MAFDPRIGQAFTFDADDLAANREGVLTPDQETIRRSSARLYRRYNRRSSGVLVLLVVVAVAAGVLVWRTASSDAPVAGLVAGLALLWIAILVLVFRRRGRRMQAGMEAGPLRHAEGRLSITTDMTETWTARVGEARFGVDRYQAERLEEGARYRVNYLAVGPLCWVLSMERAEPE